MPEATLKALATHNEFDEFLPTDGGDSDEVLGQFAREGIDINALADQLQNEGTESFVKSWNDLLAVISSKCASLSRSVTSKAS
jgi:transaldolase